MDKYEENPDEIINEIIKQKSNNMENDKLIAEFMGLSKINCNIQLYEFENIAYPMNKLKFSSDWDWLMPVVRKMSNIKGFYNIEDDLIDLKITAKIENVYSSCISFIKDYNENN